MLDQATTRSAVGGKLIMFPRPKAIPVWEDPATAGVESDIEEYRRQLDLYAQELGRLTASSESTVRRALGKAQFRENFLGYLGEEVGRRVRVIAGAASQTSDLALGRLIEDKTGDLLNLLHTLSDLGLAESGQLDLTIETVDLDSLLSECAANSGVAVSFDKGSTLPSEINADPARLLQVLLTTLKIASEGRSDASVRFSVHRVPTDKPGDTILFSAQSCEAGSEPPFELHEGKAPPAALLARHLTHLMSGDWGLERNDGQPFSIWFNIHSLPRRFQVLPIFSRVETVLP